MPKRTPRRPHARESSASGSRLKGVTAMFQSSFWRVGHMQKPSWCFVVIAMYFTPARCMSAAQASASNLAGLKRPVSALYCELGMFR